MGTLEDRERAQARPVNGPYPEYAREVRRLLGYYSEDRRSFLSLRMAEGKTGVKHTTIGTMARGFRADVYNTRRFAESLSGDPDRLLAMGGHLVEFVPDRLSRIGPDVDISAIAGIRLSPFLASAGDGFQPPDPGTFEETFESILPGQVRAIRVQGDCMAPLYADGDIVFVREQGNAENGNKVIAMVDEDKLFCKIYRTNGEAYLEPKNGEGKVLASRFRIIGVIVGVFRKED